MASLSPALSLDEKTEPFVVFNRTFRFEILVVLALIAFFLAVRVTLSVEAPGGIQQVAEMLHEFVGGQAEEIIGHDYERYLPFIVCIFLFVLCNNLLGLIPGIETPTSVAVVPLGVATLAFLYYNYHGIRVNGPINYLKTFAGPVWWIAPLLFPGGDHLAPGPCHVAHHSSLCEHAGQRPADADLLLNFPVCGAHCLSGAPLSGFDYPGLRVHAADHDLYRNGDRARTLRCWALVFRRGKRDSAGERFRSGATDRSRA